MQALLIGAATTLIMCGVGIVFRKIDVFKMVNHPLVKKYPHVSKTFGTIFICFSLIWFLLIFLLIIVILLPRL